MLIKSNIRFKLLFKKYLQTFSTSTTTSTYSTTKYRYIYFYEWSDMLKGIKTFTTESSFFDFLKECNITCTDSQREFIHNNNWCYVSCVPNNRMLIVEKQYYDLKNKLDALKKVSKPCTSLVLAH